MRAILGLLGRLVFPAVILAAAFWFVFSGGELPAALEPLKRYGPYLGFAAAAALAAVFGSGRALAVLVTLVVAYGAQQWWLQRGLATPEARAVYLAITVLVPANLALYAALPERGALNRHGIWRLALIALEIALVAAVIASGRTDLTDRASARFLVPAPFGIGAIPQAGITAILLCLPAALAAAFLSRSPVAAACAAALFAFVVAAHVPTASFTFAVFTVAAELMLAVALLQERFGAGRREGARRARRAPARRAPP